MATTISYLQYSRSYAICNTAHTLPNPMKMATTIRWITIIGDLIKVLKPIWISVIGEVACSKSHAKELSTEYRIILHVKGPAQAELIAELIEGRITLVEI
ncbi:hypothetical protein DEO72_LG3g3004 [Vigna unguiculata]|uniref:Uncharacterized protein n=1 Tax=Vigna unguiculata TaxID=3917 RepID=A0A4D6LJE3_VIGUN|nr:hypothetical protein DEO72_LG3g3004 [Vigna unguiculata]